MATQRLGIKHTQGVWRQGWPHSCSLRPSPGVGVWWVDLEEAGGEGPALHGHRQCHMAAAAGVGGEGATLTNSEVSGPATQLPNVSLEGRPCCVESRVYILPQTLC